MNKKLFLSIVLLIIISTNLVYAQGTGEGGGESPVPENGSSGGGGAIGINTSINLYPNYSEILEAFNNQTWLPVIVRLVDRSNITITGTKEERRNLSIQRYEWFKPVVDEVLATLPENDFDGEGTSTGLVGFITKNGFQLLLNDSRVSSITWTRYGVQVSSGNESLSDENKSIVEEVEIEAEEEVIEEIKSEIPEEALEIQQIENQKGKSLLHIWTILFVIVLIIIVFLIIKFRKK